MKKTISIISLIIITGLQAQSLNIASIGKELAFKLTGDVLANFAYMNSNLPQEGFVTQQGDVKPHESPEVSGRAAAGISAFDNVTDAQPLTKINKAFSHLDNAGLNRINTALGKAGGGIHTEFGELLVKLSEGNTQILAQIAGSSWEQKLTKLTTDLANAPPFKTRLLQKPELIGAWGVLDDVSPSLRKNIDELDFIDNHLTTNNKTVSQLKAEIQNTPGGYSAWKLAEAKANLLAKLDDFAGKTLKFEEKLVDATTGTRIVDVVDITEGYKLIFYEFKSVAGVPPSKFASQFIKDLSNADNLNQIKWIFNGAKNPPDFRANMIQAINDLPSNQLSRDLISKYFPNVDNPTPEMLKQLLISEFDNIFDLVHLP